MFRRFLPITSKKTPLTETFSTYLQQKRSIWENPFDFTDMSNLYNPLSPMNPNSVYYQNLNSETQKKKTTDKDSKPVITRKEEEKQNHPPDDQKKCENEPKIKKP